LRKFSIGFAILVLLYSAASLYARRVDSASAGPPAVNSRPTGRTNLRVMTYNIHVGVGMDKKLDLKRIAEVINRERPDLVGLQEVDRGVERTQRIDEVRELARLTGLEYAFANNLRFQGGWYGVAILSRFPILATDHRLYRNRREAERRGFLRIEVSVRGQPLNFVTTHLDYQYEDGRAFEAEQLLGALAETKGPMILVGDFNDEPEGSAYALVTRGFEDAWNGGDPGLTFPADKRKKRIDYVFVRPGDGIRTVRARVLDTQASDHLPLLVDLAMER
jgi:endonuclease/exonuclease/phosphatase family metal-dependent hydrolase